MTTRRSALQLASRGFPGPIQNFLVDRFARQLKAELYEKMTDDFLEALLRGMDWAFLLSGSYRRNIEGFRGVCVFRTLDNKVATTAVFEDSHMSIEDQARSTYNVRVSYQDAHALWSFLLSENQDILDSILKNTVDVDGNLNYLYRFGFLAKDLTRRLGVA
ncbi:MAG: hypothetical protein LAO56_10660 [Acidobacteriia bacterium]|nr:hypothetical protein [Terriglobia bacterium]